MKSASFCYYILYSQWAFTVYTLHSSSDIAMSQTIPGALIVAAELCVSTVLQEHKYIKRGHIV